MDHTPFLDCMAVERIQTRVILTRFKFSKKGDFCAINMRGKSYVNYCNTYGVFLQNFQDVC